MFEFVGRRVWLWRIYIAFPMVGFSIQVGSMFDVLELLWDRAETAGHGTRKTNFEFHVPCFLSATQESTPDIFLRRVPSGGPACCISELLLRDTPNMLGREKHPFFMPCADYSSRQL